MDNKKGSEIAKSGFNAEKVINAKFNNWIKEQIVWNWLRSMNIDFNDIEHLESVLVPNVKYDIKLMIKHKKQGIIKRYIQVKNISGSDGYNQIDKSWINRYAELWKIPSKISHLLKLFTGEIKHDRNDTKDKRRLFINEFNFEEQALLLHWLNINKNKVLNTILKGDAEPKAEFLLTIYNLEKTKKVFIEKIDDFIYNNFMNEKFCISKQGSIKLGPITIQRKGGDNGRNTANMLQFKLKLQLNKNILSSKISEKI